MLTIKSIASGDTAGLAKYFDALAGVEDYYGTEQEIEGYWGGSAAERFGLDGAIRAGQLIKALQCFNPITGASISQNSGNNHKPGWDCTFSSPKTVSAIWATANDDVQNTIEVVHQNAVNCAILFMEQEAIVTRHKKGGAIKVPVIEHGGALCAVFQHSTSREQDPQLHSHCIVMNFTSDGRGLDIDTRWQTAAGAFYRAELAKGLVDLGFSIERDDLPERKDWMRYFKIPGLPEELVEEWSKRRAQVQQAKIEWLTDGTTAAKFTRKAKDVISREALFARWRSQALDFGFDPHGVEMLRHQKKSKEQALSETASILEKMTFHESTFTRSSLMATLLEDAQGVTGAAEAVVRFKELLLHEDVVNIHDRTFTTRQMLLEEEAMLSRATVLAGQSYEGTPHTLTASFRTAVEETEHTRGLSDQQRGALEHIVGDTRLAALQGHAGTGKSYLLGVAKVVWSHGGLEVRGVALSNSAAKNLKKEADIQSCSVHSFLSGLDDGRTRLCERTVLVVDEAGMVGTRQMGRLLAAADLAGSKVVLVGDSQQLQPVESGGAFAGILERIGYFELTDVRRQLEMVDRQIAADLRSGRADRALKMLLYLNRLHLSTDCKAARREAVQAYLQDRTAGHSVLLLAATGAEVTNLNVGVRLHLQKSGDVAPQGVLVKVSQGYREFAVGDRLLFTEACNLPRLDSGGPGFRVINGTLGTVESARQTNVNNAVLDVKLEAGEVVQVDTALHNKINLGYAMTVHKAQGTTVDKVHVLMSVEITQGKQWIYVAGSRHRQEFHIYTTQHLASTRMSHAAVLGRSDLAQAMSLSKEKDLAVDRLSETVTRLELALLAVREPDLKSAFGDSNPLL